jgi:hypothetical protein
MSDGVGLFLTAFKCCHDHPVVLFDRDGSEIPLKR